VKCVEKDLKTGENPGPVYTSIKPWFTLKGS